VNRTIFLLFVLSISACTSVPKTTGELREEFKNGSHPLGGKRRDAIVERRFQSVLGDVGANAKRCFNVVTEHRDRGALDTWGVDGVTIYNSTSTTTDVGRAEVAVWMLADGAGGMPEGASFVVLSDVEAVGPSRTKITVYGPDTASWSDAIEAVFSWAAGRGSSCPKLP
jgi:hypothetical protein